MRHLIYILDWSILQILRLLSIKYMMLDAFTRIAVILTPFQSFCSGRYKNHDYYQKKCSWFIVDGAPKKVRIFFAHVLGSSRWKYTGHLLGSNYHFLFATSEELSECLPSLLIFRNAVFNWSLHFLKSCLQRNYYRSVLFRLLSSLKLFRIFFLLGGLWCRLAFKI